MKFNLPRQTINKTIKKIISREVKHQNTDVIRANRKNLKEMAQISRVIRHRGLPPYLVCKKLPRRLGKGIFLHPEAPPILKNQVIAPYAGEIFFIAQNQDMTDGSYAFVPLSNISLSKEEQQKIDPASRYHPRRLYSLKIDAFKKGNFTRFINHSEKPNVVAHLFTVPSNPYGVIPAPIEIIYIAQKTIHPGEQLLICYEDEEKSYWGVSKIKPFPMTPKTFHLNRALKLCTNLRDKKKLKFK
jgi:hypothetical protein